MTDTLFSRRALIATGVAGAGAALLPRAGFAQEQAGSIKPWIVINALGGVFDPNFKGTANEAGISQTMTLSANARAIADARASGMTAVNVTLGYVAGKEEPFETTVREIAAWDARVRASPADLTKVLTAADIVAAKKSDRIGLIYGFQNGAMFGEKADRVRVFADLGVRIMQLTYNIANQIGSGCLVPDDKGLTAFGREVVAQMDASRVIVDLSHSGRQTCLDAARAAKRPIAISHTGCRAVTDLPRNKTDEELRLVAERGGFVGIYFMPFLAYGRPATAADVVQHILHAVKICGEDHVGIGTDGGTTSYDDMPAYMIELRKENAARRAAGISAPGEGPDTTPFVMDLRGPGQFQKLADLLAAAGLKSAQIEKILGRNFVDYARTVWGS
jgi:membrane dipeptidase